MWMVIFTYENYLEYEKYLKETKEKDLINNFYNHIINKFTNTQLNTATLNDVEGKYKVGNSKVKNKHDKIFRTILDKKENAEYLINKAYGENLVTKDEIEKYNSSYITEIFENRESDVVYKLKNKQVFFLIEHQTKIDYSMPFRILDYEYLIMKSAIDPNKIKNKYYKLPYVMPIVLYTGKQKWDAEEFIEDKQESINNHNVKLGSYNIIDVNNYTEKELLQNNVLVSKMMLIEKAKNTKETIEYFEKIAANVKQEDKLILQRIIKIIYKEKIGKEEKNKLINKIMGGEKNMLAVLDMIDKENQMYINKGKEEGIKENCVQIIKNMLENKFSIDSIIKATKMSKEDIEKIAKSMK